MEIKTKESERLKEILVNTIEWAGEVSEQITHDLIKASGITSEELYAIGYDVDDFPSMHIATGAELCVSGIMWVVDEDENGDELPTEVVIPMNITKSIRDWLSDTYGFCHEGHVISVKKEVAY